MPKESAYFIVNNLSGKHDTKVIKQQLDTFPGVISVSVSQQKKCVAVDFDNTGVNSERLEKKMNDLGFEVTESKSEEHIM
ncbi:MAG TPA: heavy metal-associated domain protein [Oscillospiraceae bacterium]|nr:heavy metal-associated domain protein [Oscillospiraceae bacterium]